MIAIIQILGFALLPVILLIAFVYWKDRKQPEPPLELTKAFIGGVLSIIPVFGYAISLQILGWTTDLITGPPLLKSIADSFINAAIPEEIAKLGVLWFVTKNNPHFDEYMDGIVYATFVSLGFAGIENIFYLFDNTDNWMAVGSIRALFSVPGHFGNAVLMGYYYSLLRFKTTRKTKHLILLITAPILAHGIFNSLLMSMGQIESTPMILLVFFVFLAFCISLWIYGTKRMKGHLRRDHKYRMYKQQETMEDTIQRENGDQEIG